MWDPGQYLRFGDERSRPFFELTAQIGAEHPGLVVDLGCGPGQLTAELARRWPEAEVRGLDSSAEMIDAAARLEGAGPRLSFGLGDVRDWRPERPVDVIVSNAVLQWVPDHEALLAGWLRPCARAAGWHSRSRPTSGPPATCSCARWPVLTAGGRCWPTSRSTGSRPTRPRTWTCSAGPAAW